MKDSVDVVCNRGRWHKKPATLATFVREDDPVRADYWGPDGEGRGEHGWRAVREDSSVDPYRDRNAPLGARRKALRKSPPVTFDVAAGAGKRCMRCDWLAHRAAGYDWPEPEDEGHGPDCARWSAVCRCGWPTWNVPVRLMAPLLHNAAKAGRVVQAEEVEAVAGGFPGTTWLDDRARCGGKGAPDDAALNKYLNMIDRGEARSAEERRSYLAPGTRGLIPDGIALMVEVEGYKPRPARVAALIARQPWLDMRGVEKGKALALNNDWVAVDGVTQVEGGYRFVDEPTEVFKSEWLVGECERLYKEGRRSALLDDVLSLQGKE